MVKKEIIDYIKKRDIITMPAVQKKFSLSYYQTKELFAELVDDDWLCFASGVSYHVRSPKPSFCQPADRPEQNSTRPTYNLADYIKARVHKERIIEECDGNVSDTSSCEGDEDDNDFRNALFEELRQDDDDDDEEDDEEDAGDVEDVHAVENKMERKLKMISDRMKNIGNLVNIKKIFNGSIDRRFSTECFNGEVGKVILLSNGERFKLEYDGLLLKIIYYGIAPIDCTSAMRVDTIIKDYNSLSYESGRIVAIVKDNEDALDALLDIYAAVERINRGE